MPVTAKLSKALHERLGDAATNELVDWLNAVDADYRSQLRELNELNLARFDVTVEQRQGQLAVQSSQFEVQFAKFEARQMNRVFAFYIVQTVGLAAVIYGMLYGR